MASQPPQELPSPSQTADISKFEVFKLYVDAAKWLLAIISGLLVFGIDRLKDHGLGLTFWLFVPAGILLVLAAAFRSNICANPSIM